MSADPNYIPQLYGRSKGHALRARHQRLMDELLPRVSTPDPQAGAIDLGALFPQASQFALEVGFGGGEHLAWQAAHAPDTGFIGAEPFINGVAKLLTLIDEQGLGNIRVLHGDARPLIDALPPARLSRIFVLHPDPWPKKRHYKRRMISPWFFQRAARLLKPGGSLRVASDIPDYVRWTLMHARRAEGFEWTAERAADWKERPADWPRTRYEAKAVREGRAPAYLEFRRI
ncbi:MAG: tRNA (guanosine(46)-N7)-methyltransferase TrmB [Parvularculaceae bacterium]|nr:tRNA (guanosine(46)-N7)-methyltransferase TrmB [Parvularculaceae bacterium]